MGELVIIIIAMKANSIRKSHIMRRSVKFYVTPKCYWICGNAVGVFREKPAKPFTGSGLRLSHQGLRCGVLYGMYGQTLTVCVLNFRIDTRKICWIRYSQRQS